MENKYGVVEFNGKEFFVSEKEDFDFVTDECSLEECCEGFVMLYSVCESLAKEANDAVKNSDIFVYKCRDCGEWYCVTKREKDWYADRGLFIPRRCYSCRYERRVDKICNKRKNYSAAELEVSEIKKVISSVNKKDIIKQSVSPEYQEKNRIRTDGFVAGLLKAIKIIQQIQEEK